MLDRIEVVSDLQTFIVEPTAPNTNQGPLLLGGTKWYVWSSTAEEYVPVDVSDSVNDPIIIAPADPTIAAGNVPQGIGTYAEEVPPKLPPRIWIQTDAGGTVLLGLWYNFGANIGWQKGFAPLSQWTVSQIPANSLDLSLLKSSQSGMLMAANGSVAVIAATTPVPALTPAEAGQTLVVNSTGTGLAFVDVNNPIAQVAGVQIKNVAALVPGTWNNSQTNGYEGTWSTLPSVAPLGTVNIDPVNVSGAFRVSLKGWFATNGTGAFTTNDGSAVAMNPALDGTVMGYVAIYQNSTQVAGGRILFDHSSAGIDSNSLLVLPIDFEQLIPFTGASPAAFAVYAVAAAAGASMGNVILGPATCPGTVLMVEEVAVALT